MFTRCILNNACSNFEFSNNPASDCTSNPYNATTTNSIKSFIFVAPYNFIGCNYEYSNPAPPTNADKAYKKYCIKDCQFN